MGGPVLNCMSSHSPTPPHSSQHRKAKRSQNTLDELYCYTVPTLENLTARAKRAMNCVPRFFPHLMSYSAVFPVGSDSKEQALTETPKDNLPQQTRKAIMQRH